VYGNDYLISFDKKNELKSAKRLHKSALFFDYGDNEKTTVSSMHTHLPEFSEIMTATDICTTMLYQKFTQWESVQVVSEKYLSNWDCETQTLSVVKMDAIRTIAEDKR